MTCGARLQGELQLERRVRGEYMPKEVMLVGDSEGVRRTGDKAGGRNW